MPKLSRRGLFGLVGAAIIAPKIPIKIPKPPVEPVGDWLYTIAPVDHIADLLGYRAGLTLDTIMRHVIDTNGGSIDPVCGDGGRILDI